MSGHASPPQGDPGNARNSDAAALDYALPFLEAARHLMQHLDPVEVRTQATGVMIPGCSSAKLQNVINFLLSFLKHPGAQLAALHERYVYHPPGAGARAFGDDAIVSLLRQMVHDEYLAYENSAQVALQQRAQYPPLAPAPSARPIIVHVEIQPDRLLHCGGLVVLCFAFAVAHAIHRHAQRLHWFTLVSVELDIIDRFDTAVGDQQKLQNRLDHSKLVEFLSARSGIA
ncbi:uncharacterized protein B0T15DRAFT_550502 [Chaetomium strumarium]|uniref:Uncharacterized protein n=1 Tax=Chaetomium strumarium TaxID=1170767 RepID=A0AAJ0GYC8_9PEZI|nr:hypothetical protein B0T15DRAFT_550502 [Chaetomium strumarium]